MTVTSATTPGGSAGAARPYGLRRLVLPAQAFASVLERGKTVVRVVNRNRPGRRVRWGSLQRVRPFSDHYGFDRGLPVDRYYIEAFMRDSNGVIRGDVMEIRAPVYTRRFGHAVTREHVVDIDSANRHATLIADLNEPGSLPEDAYDCVIFTQTLQFLRDEGTALQNLYRSVRPGGAVLITAPSLSRVDHEIPESDYWRYTPSGLLARLVQCCPGAELSVEGHGNVLTGIAFLTGLAVEDLDGDQLDVNDPSFPTIVCAIVKKPNSPASLADTERDEHGL